MDLPIPQPSGNPLMDNKILQDRINQIRDDIRRNGNLPMSQVPYVSPYNSYISSLQQREAAFRKECHDTVQEMLHAFTFEEHMSIAFTPHVIIDTIWYFVDKVQAYCRDHRITEVKKLSRAINELRMAYQRELQKDLSNEHLKQIHEKSVKWRELNQKDLVIMYFAMGNTLLKEYKSQDYLDCMNWAYTAMKLCQLAKRYNDEINQMIRDKLGKAKDAPPHWIIDKLYAIMDAHLPDGFNVDDTQIDLSMNVFRNNLKKLKYKEL